MIGAVIYVRVSTKEQTENLSLPTQLRTCEEYCRREGYEIVERFKEEGASAKTTDRTELQKLLKYCRTHKGKVHFVVVYNLTRFAREKYDHFALRAHLKSLGISLRSATEPIDDTSTGKLMEGVLAAFAQFDNDVRSDRTRAGMRAALELGRWTFPAPLGYLNAPKWSGKSLIPDPERAALVKEMFEEFATGRFTKQEVLARVNERGLRTRRGLVLSPQSFGQMLRNTIYIGLIESPDYGVSTRGDFEPLVSEQTFYRAQAVSNERVQVTAPRERNHPDFPLRNFVRCETCGRPLTGSWSKGRNGHYAYYHCQRQCRAVNVSKAKLEGLFVDELALLQPTPGYMRLVKDRVLFVWQQITSEVKDHAAEVERRVKAIQQKLDRLDEAFLYAQTIDLASYERQRDKLREELTLAQIDHQAESIEELDVEGILAFAERVLPRASDLWVQASLNQRQRLQQLFFPEGIAFDGNRFNRTAATALFFKYLAPSESADERVASLIGIEPSRSPTSGASSFDDRLDRHGSAQSAVLSRACRKGLVRRPGVPYLVRRRTRPRQHTTHDNRRRAARRDASDARGDRMRHPTATASSAANRSTRTRSVVSKDRVIVLLIQQEKGRPVVGMDATITLPADVAYRLEIAGTNALLLEKLAVEALHEIGCFVIQDLP
jgi:DNA invertase Pin-like site-specific DNA recombinase